MNELFEEHEKCMNILENLKRTTLYKSYDTFIIQYDTDYDVCYILRYEIEKTSKIIINGFNHFGLEILRGYIRITKNELLRTTLIELSKEEIKKFLEYLVGTFLNDKYLSKCCITGEEINSDKNTIRCKDCSECKKKFNSIVTDNIIKDSFVQKNVFDFIFEAFSSFLKNKNFLKIAKDNLLLSLENVNDGHSMKTIIPNEIKNNEKDKFYEIIKESANDIEIFDKIGRINYGIFKNFLSGNYFSIYEGQIITPDQLSVNYPVLLNINYSAIIENSFSEKNVLFHGSDISSWYSILKNGLKSMSGTEFMSNGAAYGNGIYLSDKLSFSAGYSSNYVSNSNINIKYNKVVGVFLLGDKLEKYYKAPQIYVVPDEKKLILKSLIIFKNNSSNVNINKFGEHVKISLSDPMCQVGVDKIKNKRLNNELKMLNKIDCIKEIKTENEKKWSIFLEKDKCVIQVDVIFNNYPTIAPTFIIKDNSIDIKRKKLGGEDILDLNILRPDKWTLDKKIKDIVEEILSQINIKKIGVA